MQRKHQPSLVEDVPRPEACKVGCFLQLELEDRAELVGELKQAALAAEAATAAARAETAAAEERGRREAAEAAGRERRAAEAAEKLRAERKALERRAVQLAEDCARLDEVAGARSDALSAHLDLLRSEKAALQAQLADARAAAARQADELGAAERRCDAAEANADATSKVRSLVLRYAFDLLAPACLVRKCTAAQYFLKMGSFYCAASSMHAASQEGSCCGSNETGTSCA